MNFTNIAEESGENRALIPYYFGNKAGLLAALVDSILHDECVSISSRMVDVPPAERFTALVGAMKYESDSSDSFRILFDMLPYILEHQDLRERLINLYRWYVDLKLDWLGLDRAQDEEERERLKPLSRVFSAIIDGLALQALIDPEGFDLQRPYEFVATMLNCSWESLLGSSGSGDPL